MAPTPEMTRADAQAAMAHAATGNAVTGMTTFYASVSLLGVSVLFLLGYYSVKMCRGFSKPRPVYRSNSKILSKNAGATLLGRRLGHVQRAEGTAPSEKQSPPIPDEDPREVESQAWAAAYLHHVRDMEDYAAGIPHIAQSLAPTPTPPPLYSTVCREPSTGTIGIARSLEHKARLPAPAAPPRPDSEADIADILYFYSDSESDSDMDLDSNSSRSGTDSSFGSATSTLHTPDMSICEDLYPGVPAIVVDGCEDVVPPPYEEDIADQILAGAGLYLKVPSPQAVKAAAQRQGAGAARRKIVKAEPRYGRGQSILARFAKEGFFRGARTRQLRVAN